jgi:predicted nuclease of restriction endonuclease-like (RecB) superfamily/sulfur relay (sulfurtransferase) DsrC/TusE family protein
MADKLMSFDFSALVAAIRQVDEQMAAQAARAVNISLTLRNWVIGCYIREYEQNGADRAQYGQDLLNRLSSRLEEEGSVKYHSRELRRCREFYVAYPRIRGTLSPGFDRLLPQDIRKSLPTDSSAQSALEIRGTVSPELQVPAERLVNSLSFSHFAELIPIDEPLKRAFYEIECIRGHWSVRELKRQIGSVYYERSGLSRDKKKLAALAQADAEQAEPQLAIRDPYVFEFLGIKSSEVMSESDLEDALLDKLQDFLLELGHGFCFEARQKRFLIGDTHGFVDLVFYHRILKCHVLVELKIEAFTHENLGQLNTYVSWFRKNMMADGDNPPVGILLCAQKDHALVEYALAGMDNRLFVSKYQLELPKKEEIQRFLEEQMREVHDGQ